jgi:toxin ParE1/3/4
MPSKRKRSPQAQTDVDDIWLTIATDNLRAAERQIEMFYAAELRLADFPEMGRARDDLAPGLRNWTVGVYLILYRTTDYGVEIVRIVRGARDLPSLFDLEP